MKSIELGDYDIFSGLLSLFAAVIGLAYPLILQAIERIQERYTTERVSHWFEEETAFTRFFFMLKANIPIAFLAPFFLFLFCGNILLSITILAIQSVFVCLLLLYLMGLYKQVDTYNSYIKMVEYSSKEDMERMAIVMLSADHNEEKEGYDAAHDKLYKRIAELLLQEAQKRNGNLVEFPAEVLQVARLILFAAEKKEVYPRTSCDTTIISLLYDAIYNKCHATKKLRSFIWLHLNRLLNVANTDWLKSYWVWASQFYRTMRYNSSYNESEWNLFYEMHLFFAAMVLRRGQMNLIEYILNYQDSSPEPPSLLLYKTSEIIRMLQKFDNLRDCPFGLAQLYPMYFLANDVNVDHKIYRVLCDYLALSYLNIVANGYRYASYGPDEYIINDTLSKEALEREMKTLEWFKDDIVAGLKGKMAWLFEDKVFDDVNTKIDNLIDKYVGQIENIDITDKISNEKLQIMKDDICAENRRIRLSVLQKVMAGEAVEEMRFTGRAVLQASPGQLLEHHSIPNVNFAETLIAYLRHQFYAKLAMQFIINGSIKTHLIQYSDLRIALEKIKFDKTKHALLNDGVPLQNYDLGYINNEEIINIHGGNRNTSLYILKKEDCPTYMYETFEELQARMGHEATSGFVALDAANGLYWREPTKENKLTVDIIQPYIMYNRRHTRFIKINVTYNRALGECDFHKLKDLGEIL